MVKIGRSECINEEECILSSTRVTQAPEDYGYNTRYHWLPRSPNASYQLFPFCPSVRLSHFNPRLNSGYDNKSVKPALRVDIYSPFAFRRTCCKQVYCQISGRLTSLKSGEGANHGEREERGTENAEAVGCEDMVYPLPTWGGAWIGGYAPPQIFFSIF